MKNAAESTEITRTEVIDSHTAGEPTRVVLAGGPHLGEGPLQLRCERFRDEWTPFRESLLREPRGLSVAVGALLCPPDDRESVTGVIFFNNVGCLGMCGHGLIGLVESLRYLGRLSSGSHRIDTPVGTVTAELAPNGEVSFENVPSYRVARRVVVDTCEWGPVTGDVAWGGNWFFLVDEPQVNLEETELPELTRMAIEIRQAVRHAGYPAVDHVELFGVPRQVASRSRNFVLCPGSEYDRSPCGTGTSAKLACLAAEGKWAPEVEWIQEGILGSSFRGSYRWHEREDGIIIPRITGRAHIVARGELVFDPHDPFRWGIGSHRNG